MYGQNTRAKRIRLYIKVVKYLRNCLSDTGIRSIVYVTIKETHFNASCMRDTGACLLTVLGCQHS